MSPCVYFAWFDWTTGPQSLMPLPGFDWLFLFSCWFPFLHCAACHLASLRLLSLTHHTSPLLRLLPHLLHPCRRPSPTAEELGRCSPTARQTPPTWPRTWQRTGMEAQCRYCFTPRSTPPPVCAHVYGHLQHHAARPTCSRTLPLWVPLFGNSCSYYKNVEMLRFIQSVKVFGCGMFQP